MYWFYIIKTLFNMITASEKKSLCICYACIIMSCDTGYD